MDSSDRKRKWDEPAAEEKRDPASAAAQAGTFSLRIQSVSCQLTLVDSGHRRQDCRVAAS